MDKLSFPKFHPELVEESELSEKDLVHVNWHGPISAYLDTPGWRKAALFMMKQACRMVRDSSYKPIFSSQRITGLAEVVYSTMQKDGAARLSAGIISAYFNAPKEKRKIYVFQPEFFKVFAGVKLENLTYEHIPTHAVGYVELPVPVEDGHGHTFTGFYFYCGPVKEAVFENNVIGCPVSSNYKYPISDLCMAFGYVDVRGESFNYAFRMRPLDTTMTIRDSWRFSNWAEVDSLMNFKTKEMADGYEIKDALFCNTLAYINSGQPDLREFKNALRYRSSGSTKVVRADRDLSREDLCLLGFSYKKDPHYVAGEWGVDTHPRWQPYGEGKKKIKLIWVKAHTKHRRAGAEKGDDSADDLGVHQEIRRTDEVRASGREPAHGGPEVGSEPL